MPIDDIGNYLEYDTEVVDVDIPVLFGLDKMKQLKWYINEVTNEFCSFENSTLKVKLRFEKGHLYLKWPTSVVLFTRKELIKIHRRFAHPSANKLAALIKRADPGSFDPSTKRILEDIVSHYLTWIEQRPHPPALHVVDRGTHFSAAQFVKSESAESIWNTFLACWTCAKFGIIAKESPTESHNSLGPGERYHAPLRKIYQKIKTDYPLLDNETALSIANYGLNNSANPEGLVPTLLVFGSIPKLPLGNVSHLPPSQRERFQAMETSRKEMETIVTRQRLALASKKHKGKAMDAFEVCPGSEVLVYREKKKLWEGPFKLAHYDNYKTVFVDIN
eukprot:IDg7706t1